jgi:hypothetical protein
MIENFRLGLFSDSLSFSSPRTASGHRTRFWVLLPPTRSIAGYLALPFLFVVWCPGLYSFAKSNTDKFRGTVVAAGPKAITVKSRQNPYQVRTFNYSPELEKKILHKKPTLGGPVTVHYVRGTDLAVKLHD